MGFFQTTAGKVTAVIFFLAAVTILAVVAVRSGPSGTDSPSDITDQMPYSDPNDPNLIKDQGGPPLVMPTGPDGGSRK